jgi:hypothetical protein
MCQKLTFCMKWNCYQSEIWISVIFEVGKDEILMMVDVNVVWGILWGILVKWSCWRRLEASGKYQENLKRSLVLKTSGKIWRQKEDCQVSFFFLRNWMLFTSRTHEAFQFESQTLKNENKSCEILRIKWIRSVDMLIKLVFKFSLQNSRFETV